MLEVGWSEILVIALILIIVVGPKDLPPMLRTFGKMASRLRGMANEFKGQFDQAIREAELDDVRKGLSEVNKLNPTNSLRDAINPIRKLGEDIKSDLRKASDISASTTTTPVVAEEAKPADTTPPVPLMTPIADPIVPPVIEKIAEPAPIAQPLVANVGETPVDKPKVTRKKAAAPETVSEAAIAATPAEPKTRKAPVRTRDAAVAAVAAETVAKKPVARKKPAPTEVGPDVAVADATKPKKAAPRKTAEKSGDA